MDWQSVVHSLRTEQLVATLSGTDPLSLARDPYIMGPFVLALVVMAVLKMVRTIVFLFGVIALWLALVYTIPSGGDVELELSDLAAFVGVCVAVAAAWIYVFFVRGD